MCDVCAARFATLVSITMHRYSAHKAVHLARVLVFSNQCYLCCKVFSTLEICKRHVMESWSTGRCARRAVAFSHPVVVRTTTCGACGENFDTPQSLRSHVLVAHTPPALVAQVQDELALSSDGD